MEKENIIKYLKENNVENAEVLLDFLESGEDSYSRKNTIGHITGSSFILSDDLENSLLILHAKYNKWLSPGGHVDDGENSLKASIRETFEEVGLDSLDLLNSHIFDIDIHRIPSATKNGVFEPEHWHFDIRYLFKIKPLSKINLNTLETKGFKWVSLNELKSDADKSISRQASKAMDFKDVIKDNELNKDFNTNQKTKVLKLGK